ncbi:MAG: diguanylate cyclase [Arenicellales bacterium]
MPVEALAVMVGASEAVYRRFAEGLSGQYAVRRYDDSEALCQALDGDPEMADVIVFSHHLARPLGAAAGVLSRARDAAVLILCRPEDEWDYTRRLSVTPHMDQRVHLLPVVDDAGLPERVCRLGSEVRRRRAYRRTLAAAQRQLDNGQRPQRPPSQYLEQLLEHLPIGILNVDIQGRLQSFNRAARRLLTMTAEPVSNTSVLELFPPAAREVVAELLADSDAGAGARPQVTLQGEKGNSRVIELSKSPVADYGGEPIVILMLQDVTEVQNLLDHMRHDANHDILTGLINRREFRARLETALTAVRRRGACHVLCYMDLDGFKKVNDSAGHQAGDEMLRQIAGLMRRGRRVRDSLARWGGDEFVMLLEHCSLDDAERVASALVERVSGFEFQWEAQLYRVGVSIGIAPVGPDAASTDELLSTADEACYAAKQRGGNRVSRHG